MLKHFARDDDVWIVWNGGQVSHTTNINARPRTKVHASIVTGGLKEISNRTVDVE